MQNKDRPDRKRGAQNQRKNIALIRGNFILKIKIYSHDSTLFVKNNEKNPLSFTFAFGCVEILIAQYLKKI